jgi:hypothetical protein
MSSNRTLTPILVTERLKPPNEIGEWRYANFDVLAVLDFRLHRQPQSASTNPLLFLRLGSFSNSTTDAFREVAKACPEGSLNAHGKPRPRRLLPASCARAEVDLMSFATEGRSIWP